jgi:hypothetical protein
MVKAKMKRRWKWVLGGAVGGLAAVALLASAVAWRLHALPAEQVQGLARDLGAEHEAMWASVWGPLPKRADEAGAYESLGWSLWPRPRIHLHGVRWAVPAELSSDGELRIERLTLGLDWRSLWLDAPRLHDLRAQGLQGASRNTQWGLQGEWRVQQVSLGPADATGARALAWTLDASVRPLREAVAGTDPRPPWLAGQWQGRARWHPAADREPAHWRQVDLRFKGHLSGQVVPSARLTLARWLHQGDQQRLAWDDLTLQAQLGEAAKAAHIEWRVAALDLRPDSASGQGMVGSWKTAAPLSLTWQMESAPPRGRYAAVTWPQWRLVPSGREGTRAGGQLQADLGWLPDRRALRWDALLGEVSVQPRGEAERQWRLRGQLELGVRAASWQLDGQAQGGAPDAALWDGPFATEGEWRRWPNAQGQAQADARLRLASLWLDRWHSASRSATWPALWSTLDTWPGRLQLHVGQLGWQGLRLAGAEATLSQQDGVIRLVALDARLWDGPLNASGEWRLADGRWQLAARARDADLALLRQTLAERQPGGPPTLRQGDAASGRWSGALSLSGLQDDVRAWQGQWSVDGRAGHWQGLDLRAARQAADATPRTPEPSERTDWRRLLATGKVAGGVAHIDQLQLQYPAGRMAADGTLDLETGELDLAWSDLAGSRKRGPVLSMTGPWRAPLTRLP